MVVDFQVKTMCIPADEYGMNSGKLVVRVVTMDIVNIHQDRIQVSLDPGAFHS